MPDSAKTDEIKAMFERAAAFMDDLMKENERLRHKLGTVEQENRSFAERYVQIEEHNEMLQNLYVTSHRLHATLEPAQVLATIKEIIVNLVGTERFGIWMFDEGAAGHMTLLAHEGLEGTTELDAGELAIAEKVLGSGEAWYRPDGATTPPKMVAIVPLKVDDRGVGLIAIRGLLGHKKQMNALDQQILGLLSGQAATALTSARLYAEKSRKLDTMKAFLDFIKTKG